MFPCRPVVQVALDQEAPQDDAAAAMANGAPMQLA
jgi:hypothetical protein